MGHRHWHLQAASRRPSALQTRFSTAPASATEASVSSAGRRGNAAASEPLFFKHHLTGINGISWDLMGISWDLGIDNRILLGFNMI